MIKKILVLLGVVLSVSSCTQEDDALRILRSQGFHNIQITGFRFFGCDEKDTFHTGFVATSQSGQRLSGVVCSGFLKGSTVRFD